MLYWKWGYTLFITKKEFYSCTKIKDTRSPIKKSVQKNDFYNAFSFCFVCKRKKIYFLCSNTQKNIFKCEENLRKIRESFSRHLRKYCKNKCHYKEIIFDGEIFFLKFNDVIIGKYLP